MSRFFPSLEAPLGALREEVSRAVGQAAPGVRELGEEMLRGRASLARPGVMLAAAGAFGAAPDARLRGLAEVLELVHLASSLHDEGLVHAGALEEAGGDGAWARRGAILLGDLLLARAMQLLAEHGDPDAVAAVAVITGDLAEGRILEATPAPGGADPTLETLRLRAGSFFYDAQAQTLYVWCADGGDT